MGKEKASAALFDQLQTAIEGGEGEEIVGKVKVGSRQSSIAVLNRLISPIVSIWCTQMALKSFLKLFLTVEESAVLCLCQSHQPAQNARFTRRVSNVKLFS